MPFKKCEYWTRCLKTWILIAALPKVHFLTFSVLICELGIHFVYLSM